MVFVLPCSWIVTQDSSRLIAPSHVKLYKGKGKNVDDCTKREGCDDKDRARTWVPVAQQIVIETTKQKHL